ncbi:alcohol dehydrogenase [Chromatiales bacterium (ex Bugula neritina AB1)]|nr:alcohol dehydrogenase [Chromatiales bacterium (ex Bugula neritina AB1)]
MSDSKALFIHGKEDVRVGDYVAGEPLESEVMVSVAACGVCGSDLHYYKDGGIGGAVIDTPFIPGHEFSATLSVDVPELNMQQGELVAVDPATPCYHCEWCHKGYHNLCPQVRFIGSPPFDGAMTPSLAVPRTGLVKLPASVTADQAAMLEPLGVCIHAIDLGRPRWSDSVAVIGCGGIGLGLIQLLALCGCQRIIAIDPQAHRAEKARALGAHFADTQLQAVLENSADRGCDLVLEATNSPDGLLHSIQAAAIGGRVVMVGIPDGDTYSAVSAAEARRRGLDLRFSRRMGNVYDRAIALVREQRVDVDTLITHRFNLKESPAAFSLQAEEDNSLIKSMIYPAAVV